DPGENVDLAGSRPGITQRLTEDLDAWRDTLGLPALDAEIKPPVMPELTAEECQSLVELGYMQGPC
ncbi:MAG: hypothetical protein ACI8PZ_002986, partial [Myxococcota bacterium]